MNDTTTTPEHWRRAAAAIGHHTALAHVDNVRGAGFRLDECDPPDLSGEWAGAPTPSSLFEEITSLDAHAESTWQHDAYVAVVDELCEAFEGAVQRVWAVALKEDEVAAQKTLLVETEQELHFLKVERDENNPIIQPDPPALKNHHGGDPDDPCPAG